MKKTNSFEKFIPKKKNSAIKEEIRQQKRKWKKERAEAIELKKAANRKQAAATSARAEKPASKSAGKGTKHAAPGLKTQDSRLTTASRQSVDGDAPKTAPLIVRKKGAEEMPLNKYIAHCGVCSRRDAAELVKEGKIKVNGTIVTEPGFKVKTSDDVKMNNKKIFLAHNLVYILLNKPKDYITTAEDPQGRKTVLELVRSATSERIFPVGRLDRNTTGVLLLTNDGELTQKLSHPSYEVRKMYEVKLDKPLAKVDFDKILKGMTLEDGPVQVDALAFADPKDKSVIGIELHSGKNRIVRRIFEALGYDVRNLDRVMFANLTKKNVERGKWRFLKEKEVRLLKFMNSSFIRKNKKKEA